jgi:type VI secretion system protein ImpK
MIDKMYWACAGGLSLASQVGLAKGLPPADELQRRVSAMFDQMARRCREVGIPEEDFNEARYAIAAFIDEQVTRTDWPGRTTWLSRPLQFLYFNENTAGEGFFSRMAALEGQSQRAHVLEIYYLCLELGFQGKYAVRAGEGLAPILDQVGAEVSRALPPSEIVSPHGEPRDPMRTLVQRERPIVTLSLAFLGLALAGFLVLKLILIGSASSTTSKWTKFAAQSLTPGVAAPGQPARSP